MVRYRNSTSARVALNCNSVLPALKCHIIRTAAFHIESLRWTYFSATRADVQLSDIQNGILSLLNIVRYQICTTSVLRSQHLMSTLGFRPTIH